VTFKKSGTLEDLRSSKPST